MRYKYMIKNNFFLLTLFLIVALCNPSFAEIKKGQWEYVKDSDYCLIQSFPLKTDIPEGKLRGENYLLASLGICGHTAHQNPLKLYKF